jgi:1-deoxy-D-xylulose 5-phosphate reductoisomerase
MDDRKKVAILGCTGSVGMQTIDVISKMSDEFEIYSLTAHSRAKEAAILAAKYEPKLLCITGKCDKNTVEGLISDKTKVIFSQEGVMKACEGADIVLLSILGIAALPAFEYCLKNHIPVALASKEAMVCGGRVARDLMDYTSTPVYPVDSELSAIFQSLRGNKMEDVEKILLTASGGPFRNFSIDEINCATKEQALKHPNWSMGQKISIDSATMANKGLEIMETRWLFDIPADKITVVVHPESIVHSAVEYKDGAIIAQLGATDMRLPIQYALNYPKRETRIVEKLDLFKIASLHFEKADENRFPCLRLAYEAIKSKYALQLVFNCANEFAVDWFLKDKIQFGEIPLVIERAMERFSTLKVSNFSDIYLADGEIREYCKGMLSS